MPKVQNLEQNEKSFSENYIEELQTTKKKLQSIVNWWIEVDPICTLKDAIHQIEQIEKGESLEPSQPPTESELIQGLMTLQLSK